MLETFSSLATPVNFYLMRHGQSEGNARGVMQGLRDFPLTEKGRTQAAETAEFFRDRNIDAIVSSPLKRAAETARIVSDVLGSAPPESHELLTELDTGGFSGLTTDEASVRFPEEYRRFRSESWAAVHDAESPEDLYDRAVRAWGFLASLAVAGKRNILAVSHGGFMHWLVKATTGTRSWMPLLPMGNCGIYHFFVDPIPGNGSVYASWRLMNHRIPADGTGPSVNLRPQAVPAP
jgi:broad specificity phosphatase PhoE